MTVGYEPILHMTYGHGLFAVVTASNFVVIDLYRRNVVYSNTDLRNAKSIAFHSGHFVLQLPDKLLMIPTSSINHHPKIIEIQNEFNGTIEQFCCSSKENPIIARSRDNGVFVLESDKMFKISSGNLITTNENILAIADKNLLYLYNRSFQKIHEFSFSFVIRDMIFSGDQLFVIEEEKTNLSIVNTQSCTMRQIELQGYPWSWEIKNNTIFIIQRTHDRGCSLYTANINNFNDHKTFPLDYYSIQKFKAIGENKALIQEHDLQVVDLETGEIKKLEDDKSWFHLANDLFAGITITNAQLEIRDMALPNMPIIYQADLNEYDISHLMIHTNNNLIGTCLSNEKVIFIDLNDFSIETLPIQGIKYVKSAGNKLFACTNNGYVMIDTVRRKVLGTIPFNDSIHQVTTFRQK